MSDNTGIEWTDATWNPVTGCTEVSAGCDHCYAKTFAERWRGTPGHYFENGFDVQLRPGKLLDPLHWKKPRRIFVNSMSDLFHDDVPDDFIAQVWNIMRRCPQHTFQILTKRHARMRALLNSDAFQEHCHRLVGVGNDRPEFAHYRTWPLPNVWLGVSTENQQWADIRIPALLDTPAAVRFVSAEPLLGPIYLAGRGYLSPDEFDRPGLDWVITGGESGPGARPMHPDWARGLRDQCAAAGVPFLFKQWGAFQPIDHGCIECAPLFVERQTGRVATDDDMWNITGGYWWGVKRKGKKAAGRELDGRTWDEYPAAVTA